LISFNYRRRTCKKRHGDSFLLIDLSMDPFIAKPIHLSTINRSIVITMIQRSADRQRNLRSKRWERDKARSLAREKETHVLRWSWSGGWALVEVGRPPNAAVGQVAYHRGHNSRQCIPGQLLEKRSVSKEWFWFKNALSTISTRTKTAKDIHYPIQVLSYLPQILFEWISHSLVL